MGLLIFVAFEGIGKFNISIFNISESEISKNRDWIERWIIKSKQYDKIVKTEQKILGEIRVWMVFL